MLKYIDVGLISQHPDNPRKDLGDLTELADSIRANGILQNLTVVKAHESFISYRCVIGHRRLAAAKLAGLQEVPCMISDMEYPEQIATMLLENMQRNDLTVYEQAQSFQMLLGFGETINTIAEKTGFSETTVRRRVKLIDLDQEKFKASVERGGTLMDYAELEKIKDIDLRNSVLESLGTSNFQWKLRDAIAKEAAEKNKNALIEELRKFALQVNDTAGLRLIRHYSCYSQIETIDIPKDAGEAKYYFMVSDQNWIALYVESFDAQPEPQANTNTVTQNDNRLQLRESFRQVTERAYQLRQDFVFGLSNAAAKKSFDIVIGYAVRALFEDRGCSDFYSCFAKVFNIQVDEAADEMEDIGAVVKEFPARSLLMAVYGALDSEHLRYWGWDNQYEKDEDLNLVYEFLGKLGYEMSDEEIALQNGTHELFTGREAAA